MCATLREPIEVERDHESGTGLVRTLGALVGDLHAAAATGLYELVHPSLKFGYRNRHIALSQLGINTT